MSNCSEDTCGCTDVVYPNPKIRISKMIICIGYIAAIIATYAIAITCSMEPKEIRVKVERE
jgi:hypothetical protein